MNPAAKPEISVLIPAYNGAPWIAETLNRLAGAAGGLPYEAIVVDNASADGTAEICRRVPGARIIRNETNRGFSRAVNQAAAASSGRVLVAVNQDLHLQPGSLKAVHGFLAENDGLIGGALSCENGAEQPSCGPFPTLAQTLWRLPLPRRMRKYDLARPHSKQAQAVDWVTGAFMGLRRELFDTIGGFDENYFMYYEDVDFCLRARRAGIRSYFLPSAKGVHLHPFSGRDGAPDWLRQEVRFSQMRYFRKHRPGWEQAVILALNRAYFLVHGWTWRAHP
ncbi:MAG: glycosyltransferase family 2 protein [Elusimicrobiota bacterium]